MKETNIPGATASWEYAAKPTSCRSTIGSPSGMLPPTIQSSPIEPLLLQLLAQTPAQRNMRARQDRNANDVDIGVARLGRDDLGRLPQAGVDHFKSGFHQGVNDDFCADIVAIQTRLSDQNFDPPFIHADTPEISLTLTPDEHKRH